MSLYQLEREANRAELVAHLRQGSRPEIRARAASVLGELEESAGEMSPAGADGDEQAVEAVVSELVSAATSDDDPRVRAAAVDALDLHGPGAIERLVAELTGRDLGSGAEWVTARAFADVLDAEQPELRMAAAAGLGRVGDTDATPVLVDRLDDPSARVRARAARACGRIGDPRAAGPLGRCHDDPSTDVRHAVADALGSITTQEAREGLVRLADDDSESVRRAAVDALGNFRSVEPVDLLIGALRDESEVVRRAAAFSLVELLSNAPPAQSHEVREAAVDRLEAVNSGAVVGPLADILNESDGSPQRRNAAWLLGRVADAERARAQAALVEALDDPDDRTAQFAASSLAGLGGPGLERRLLGLLEDPDSSTDARAQAIFVLGKVGGEDSRARLDSFVDSTDDQRLRKRALSALSKLGGHPSGGEAP
jgi:HEAT repeat protein